MTAGRKYSTVVSLGSSFAAGPGIAPIANRSAGRSRQNAAQIVSRILGAELIDASVSGATTATILSRSQRAGVRRFAPQVEKISPHADLVLLTAGGNDLDYIGALHARAQWNARASRRAPLLRAPTRMQPPPRRPLADLPIDVATDGLTRIVREARARAPRSRVILVDYLPVIDEFAAPGRILPLSETEIQYFRGVGTRLSAAFSTAAARTDVDLVPASAYAPGHGADSPLPYTRGLERRNGDGAPFHPTSAGMRAVAEEILRLLRASDG